MAQSLSSNSWQQMERLKHYRVFLSLSLLFIRRGLSIYSILCALEMMSCWVSCFCLTFSGYDAIEVKDIFTI